MISPQAGQNFSSAARLRFSVIVVPHSTNNLVPRILPSHEADIKFGLRIDYSPCSILQNT